MKPLDSPMIRVVFNSISKSYYLVNLTSNAELWHDWMLTQGEDMEPAVYNFLEQLGKARWSRVKKRYIDQRRKMEVYLHVDEAQAVAAFVRQVRTVRYSWKKDDLVANLSKTAEDKFSKDPDFELKLPGRDRSARTVFYLVQLEAQLMSPMPWQMCVKLRAGSAEALPCLAVLEPNTANEDIREAQDCAFLVRYGSSKWSINRRKVRQTIDQFEGKPVVNKHGRRVDD